MKIHYVILGLILTFFTKVNFVDAKKKISKSDLGFQAAELAPLFDDINKNLTSDQRTKYSNELLKLTAVMKNGEIRCHLQNLVFLLKLSNYVIDPIVVTGEVIEITKEYLPHLKEFVKKISKESEKTFPLIGMQKNKFYLAVEKTIPIFAEIGKYMTRGMTVYFRKSLLRYADSFKKENELHRLLRSLAFVVKLRDYVNEHIIEDTLEMLFDVTPHFVSFVESMVDDLKADIDSKKQTSCKKVAMFRGAFVKPAAFGTVLKIYNFLLNIEHHLVLEDPVILHFDNGIFIMNAMAHFHWHRNSDAEEEMHHETHLEKVLKLIMQKVKSEIISLKKFEPMKKKKETVLKTYGEIRKFIKKNSSRLPQNSLLQLHFDNTLEIITFSENNIGGASDAKLKTVSKKVNKILSKEVTAIENFIVELAVSESDSDNTHSDSD